MCVRRGQDRKGLKKGWSLWRKKRSVIIYADDVMVII